MVFVCCCFVLFVFCFCFVFVFKFQSTARATCPAFKHHQCCMRHQLRRPGVVLSPGCYQKLYNVCRSDRMTCILNEKRFLSHWCWDFTPYCIIFLFALNPRWKKKHLNHLEYLVKSAPESKKAVSTIQITCRVLFFVLENSWSDEQTILFYNWREYLLYQTYVHSSF